jgi:hypothetical protein
LVKAYYLNRPKTAPVPSVDDLMEAELTEAAVQEGIAILTPWVKANPARTIKSLTKFEMTSLAQGMISKWIVARSKMEAANPNDAIDDLWRNA